GLGIFQFDLLQLFSAGHFADLRLVEDVDVRARFHASRKIDRHLHIISPNEKKYLGRALGKEHRRLPGRVAAAGDNDRFVATKLTFQRGGSVVNTHTLELLAALGFEPTIIRASCNEESFCAKHGRATLRLEADAVLTIGAVLQREGLGWRGKYRAESVGLKLS